MLGVEPNLVPVKVADVPMKARRPQYAALSNDKLARAGVQMPTWQDALGDIWRRCSCSALVRHDGLARRPKRSDSKTRL